MSERMNGRIPRQSEHVMYRRGLRATPQRIDYIPPSQRSTFETVRRRAPKEEAVLENRLENAFPFDLGNKELRAREVKEEFLFRVAHNRVTAWTGETGTGKSTQGIQFLIEAGYRVIAIVPRKGVADNLGDRIREELAAHFGEKDARDMVDIIHGDRTEKSGKARATIMTPMTYIKMEESLLEELEGEQVVGFGDEIHEANIHIETAVASMALEVEANPNWKLVLASATMDESLLQGTFRELNENTDIPVVKIEGRPHNVEVVEWLDIDAVEAYLRAGEQHTRTIIFTKGVPEIEDLEKRLREALGHSAKDVIITPYHASLTAAERRSVNDPLPEGSRQVILATNAAMSGMTFPGTTYVIVEGLVNSPEIDAYQIEGILPRLTTQSEITQMFGRAARDVSGGLGALVAPTDIMRDSSKNEEIAPAVPFDEREKYPPAEIYNTNLSGSVLSISAGYSRQFADVNKHLIHRTTGPNIAIAQKALSRLGALELRRSDAGEDLYEVTPVGRAMDRYPLAPQLARGLVEARNEGRPLIHLGRMALIAAAIDRGGLQDYSKDTAAWGRLIRPSTHDDFIAQLDLMTPTFGLRRSEEMARHIREYDLHPSHTEQSVETAHKVLRQLDIHPDNLFLTPPKSEEERALHEDFTAGMIDLVYEKSTHERNVQYYEHLLGKEGGTGRTLSDRSFTALDGAPDLVVGFPRWYQTRGRTARTKQVIDRSFPGNPEVIAKHASKIPSNLTLEPIESGMDGARVVELSQKHFGSIPIGEPEVTRSEILPESSREKLFNYVLRNKGYAQEALRELAGELEWYLKTTPKEIFEASLKPGAPEIITNESINQRIRDLTEKIRDAPLIDNALAEYLYSKNLIIDQYFDEETLELLRANSPRYKRIGDKTVEIFYDRGEAYITKVGATQRRAPLEDYILPDGREILIQVSRSAKLGGTVRVSPRSIAQVE